jgi:hypothetical protein
MKRPCVLVLSAGLALIAALPARAALSSMYNPSSTTPGGGSLIFLGLDTTAQASVTVNLGYFYTDAVGAAFNTPGTSIQWNFAANTLSVNGSAQSGTYNWSVPYAFFNSAATQANTKWAVISGADLGQLPQNFVTSGNPTAAQLGAQNTGVTTNMQLVESLITNTNGLANTSTRSTTQNLAGFGANSVVGETSNAAGYVGNTGTFGSNGNWQGNLKWNAFAAAGNPATNINGFWTLNDEVDGATKLAGVFTYNAGVLSYTTAPVPEAEAGLLAAAGLSVLWFARRRRAQA